MHVFALYYSETSSRQKILDDALVDMVAKDYRPISLVEDEGFKNFVSLLDPKYVIPTRRKLRALIEAKYEQERVKAIEEISRATHVSLTTDLWTSLSCESYMAVTAHFIDSTWTLKSVSLTTSRFPETHTSLHIGNALDAIIECWKIEKKVTSIVTDNASNMVAAIPLIENGGIAIKHVPCLAHTLNIIVKRALGQNDTIHVIREKSRKIVTFFKSSCTAKEKLQEMQKLLKKPEHKLVQEVETRWNSTFYMLSRLLEQKDCVVASLSALGSNIEIPRSHDWTVLSGVLEVLQPFEIITKELSTDLRTSISKIIPINRQLHHILNTFQHSETLMDVTKQLAKNMLEQLDRKFGLVEQNKYIAFATILDPRFKKLAFMSEDKAEEIVQHLISEGVRIRNTRAKESVTTQGDSPGPSNPPRDHGLSIWADFDVAVHVKNKSHHVRADMIVEMQRYLGEVYLLRSEDPLEYWHRHEATYPTLATLAKKYLAPPATSVPSERIFSKAGLIINKQRSRLKGDIVDKLVFLNVRQ